MATYTKTDFDTQVTAFITAITANNITGAAVALATAEAILQSIGFNVHAGDAGFMIQRRDSLRGMWKNVFGDMSYYDIYAEQVGTAAETMFQAPAGIDGGVPNQNNTKPYLGPAPVGS